MQTSKRNLVFIRFYLDAVGCSVVSWGGLFLCWLRSQFGRERDSFKKIVVVQNGHLGDIILTLPLIDGLKLKYPESEICLLTSEAGAVAAAAFFNDVRVIKYKAGKMSTGNGDDSPLPDFSEFQLIVHLRGDIRLLWRYFVNIRAFFLYGLPQKNKLRWAPLFLLGIPVPWQRGREEHQFQTFKNIAAKLGISLDNPKIAIRKEWRDSLISVLGEDILKGEGFAVFHPGAPWEYRRWPSDCFSDTAAKLSAEYNMKVFVVGAIGEKSIVDAICRNAPSAINLAGKLDIKQLAALFAACRIYIGNDSGPAHLAAAVGAKIVALYGPQEPGLFGVLAERSHKIKESCFCSPCWQHICLFDGKNCMSKITSENVMASARKLL